MKMDFNTFAITTYFVMSHTARHIDFDENSIGALLAQYVALIIVCTIYLYLISLALVYCWGTSLTPYLGPITQTQACGLISVGYILIPFSIPKKDKK
jgi:hypothetical protein